MNDEIIPRRFNRHFHVSPVVDYKQLRKRLEKSDDFETLPSDLIRGGTAFFFATGSLRSGKMKTSDYLYVEIGIALSLQRPNGRAATKPRVKPYVYSTLYGSGVREAYYDEYLSGSGTKREVQEKLQMVLRRSVAYAKKKVKGPATAVLDKFKIPRLEKTE